MRLLCFVYGSLKRNFYNNPVVSDTGEYIGDFITKAEYTMYDLGHYPAVSEKGNTSIRGEIWEVPNLKELDKLEGCPYFYQRKLIKTVHGMAWMYVMPDELAKQYSDVIIPTGEWKEETNG